MTTMTNTLRLSMLLTLVPAFSAVTQAQTVYTMTPTSINVFTTTNQPISNLDAVVHQRPDIKVQVHTLDGIKRFEVYLSQGLPGNADKARDIAIERLGSLNKAMRRLLEQSATALARALQYGVEQYPAIVFDGEVVVYGITDLRIALAHYRHWQQVQTP